MTVVIEAEGDVVVVAPSGRLDSGNAQAVERDVAARLPATQPRLVIDLTHLEYISSAGLRALLILAKKCKAARGNVVLCGMQDGVREIFQIGGFLTIFTVRDTREQALGAL
jgi:stage II sporulation protein AA (anti-sigma F factor antagonist)